MFGIPGLQAYSADMISKICELAVLNIQIVCCTWEVLYSNS